MYGRNETFTNVFEKRLFSYRNFIFILYFGLKTLTAGMFYIVINEHNFTV